MNGYKAFSIIELLVVISVIAMLMAILVPVLNISRSQAKQIVCKNNLQQLIIANGSYANDNSGCFVPAALDILTENKHRWYGTRNDANSPFDTTKGPLASYLANKTVGCPQRPAFAKQKPSSQVSFADYDADYEVGCGGYGYNMINLGSRIWIEGYEDQSCKSTANSSQVRRPARTLVFADTAMAKVKNGGLYCVEYSFAEPRYYLINGIPDTHSWDPLPSIHFRHRGQASVGWVDGHISSEKMGRYDGTNSDGAKPSKFNIGWFEPMDNTPFDLN
jgi:prepilin-type N-terminal cleavage/methylation domain-containing protein/prepilin-type processing-associated H-X9-DG protein